MPSENDKNQLEKQYTLAINARDKLNDNFHKWMTYYYVANGAILIAITSIYTKLQTDKGMILLSCLGVFICLLWNLSCKGYYYWSKSWIYIIIALEKRLTNEEVNFGVYSVFSKQVAETESSWLLPNEPANISTPKLTLFFSLCAIFSWTIFLCWQFWIQYSNLTNCRKTLILIFGLLIVAIIYSFVLPKFAKSRDNNSHSLI